MTIEGMWPKTKYLQPDTVAEILFRMHDEAWQASDAARFLELWRQSNRLMTLFNWLMKPEDELDRRLLQFLRDFLLIDE